VRRRPDGWREALAEEAGRVAAEASRRLGAGEGQVLGGRVTLALDRRALARLTAGRDVAVVSGTNGKTTTTHLLAAALGGPGRVVTNAGGANLPAGIVAALTAARAADGSVAVLEVDEAWLPRIASEVRPRCAVLLNLSRDQLDRLSEVRMLAQRWREWLEGAPDVEVVATVDDPLVVWAAGAARRVRWVATGLGWREDAGACPACGAPLLYGSFDGLPEPEASAVGLVTGTAPGVPADDPGPPWRCPSCGLARPSPDAVVVGDELRRGDEVVPLALGLPGRFNRANAALAIEAAVALGGAAPEAAARVAEVREVAGRFAQATIEVDGLGAVGVRLLLAKNPAGFSELFGLLAAEPTADVASSATSFDLPVVIGINARVADGRDTSWLYDVPFERLQGRVVVATGERWRDLAVRLRYAEVAHSSTPDLRAAVARAVRLSGARAVEVVSNYTAFQGARRAFLGGGVARRRPGPGGSAHLRSAGRLPRVGRLREKGPS
jgi:UDP-N-acetylmuramyl tripeptide synthase